MMRRLPNVELLFTVNNISSVREYIDLDKDGTWVNMEEVAAISHLLNTQVYVHVPATSENRISTQHNWARLHPGLFNEHIDYPFSEAGIYLVNANSFEVVPSTVTCK